MPGVKKTGASRDILLYDRLYTLYPNISVCSVNCDYQSFDLQNALNSMGAKIYGAGTNNIIIK